MIGVVVKFKDFFMAKKAAKKKAVKKAAAKKSGIVSHVYIEKSRPKNATGKLFWTLMGHNNECLSASEEYSSQFKCRQTAYQVAEQLGVPVRWAAGTPGAD